MDVDRIREDFPILKSGVIYFDNTATCLTPEPVVAAMVDYYHNYRANIHRGLHHLSQKASEKYEQAHETISGFLGTKSEQLVLTKNTTEALNTIARGIDWTGKVVVTEAEHHSNLIPWFQLEKEGKVEVGIIPVGGDGKLDMVRAKEIIDDETSLVSIYHVSNVLGTHAPLDELQKLARKHRAAIAVDGAQSAGNMKIEFDRSGWDFFTFAGHKGLLGPTGTGGLLMKKKYLDELEPLCPGGGTVRDVTGHNWEWVAPPEKFEGGTPDIAGVIGLGEGCRYVEKVGLGAIQKRDHLLKDLLYDGLKRIDGVTVYGPKERSAIVSFNIKGMNFHDVAGMLDNTAKICVRSGAHCAIPLMKKLGVEGTVRASLHFYNTEKEIEIFLKTVREIASAFA